MYAPTLLETRRPRTSGGSLGTGAVSFVIHAALIAAAVYASLHTKALETVGRLIIDVPLYQAPAPRLPDLPTFAPSPVAFNTLAIPTAIPAVIPPPSSAPFDAASFSGLGVEAAFPLGRDTVAHPAVRANAIYAAEVLEERPERLGGTAPRYPDLLRKAGIGGRVRLEFVLDTTGRVEAGSAHVLESTHALFSQAALEAVGTWIFRPGRIDGRAVKVRVRMPVEFVRIAS
jgi:protein TonB